MNNKESYKDIIDEGLTETELGSIEDNEKRTKVSELRKKSTRDRVILVTLSISTLTSVLLYFSPAWKDHTETRAVSPKSVKQELYESINQTLSPSQQEAPEIELIKKVMTLSVDRLSGKAISKSEEEELNQSLLELEKDSIRTQ